MHEPRQRPGSSSDRKPQKGLFRVVVLMLIVTSAAAVDFGMQQRNQSHQIRIIARDACRRAITLATIEAVSVGQQDLASETFVKSHPTVFGLTEQEVIKLTLVRHLQAEKYLQELGAISNHRC